MSTADEPTSSPLDNLCHADPRVKSMDIGIRQLFKGASFAGPALTVVSRPAHNLAIHRAVPLAKSGNVMLVDMAGSCECGPCGEILAKNFVHRGIVGLVLDGTVRDGDDLEEMGYSVFCRGLNVESGRDTLDILGLE